MWIVKIQCRITGGYSQFFSEIENQRKAVNGVGLQRGGGDCNRRSSTLQRGELVKLIRTKGL